MNTPQKTDFEKRREEMMEHKPDDLGFRIHRKPETLANWGILAAMVLAALVVPIAYIGFGVVSGVASTQTGFILSALFLVLLAIGAVGAIYLILKRSKETRHVPEEQGEYIDHEQTQIVRSNRIGRLASDVMVAHPVACGHLDSVIDCAKVMYHQNVGCVLVTDANDICLGMITDRDLVCSALAQDLDPVTTPVTELMERDFKSVKPTQSLDEVIAVMRESGIRRVPVIDGTRCVGIISVDDLIARQLVSLDDISAVLARQLSEPNARHGVSDREDRVA